MPAATASATERPKPAELFWGVNNGPSHNRPVTPLIAVVAKTPPTPGWPPVTAQSLPGTARSETGRTLAPRHASDKGAKRTLQLDDPCELVGGETVPRSQPWASPLCLASPSTRWIEGRAIHRLRSTLVKLVS